MPWARERDYSAASFNFQVKNIDTINYFDFCYIHWINNVLDFIINFDLNEKQTVKNKLLLFLLYTLDYYINII